MYSSLQESGTTEYSDKFNSPEIQSQASLESHAKKTQMWRNKYSTTATGLLKFSIQK